MTPDDIRKAQTSVLIVMLTDLSEAVHRPGVVWDRKADDLRRELYDAVVAEIDRRIPVPP